MIKPQDPRTRNAYLYPIHPYEVPYGPTKYPDTLVFSATEGDTCLEWIFQDLSTIPDIVSWSWDFGDESPPDVRADSDPFTYEYADPGTYEVTLTVTLGNGNVLGPISVMIHVTCGVAIIDSNALAIVDSNSLSILGDY